ncbi:MAG: hypothetical protein EOO81_12185 [Oxalobacteraceae bacterium]|nr:MAG: hypothetical protein EOO81_12185 [Oxalobacteraceae bacterium]
MTASTGVDKAKPFVDWLNANNYRGLIGEFGVPATDSRWLTVMDNFLRYATLNGVHTTAWAGGFMWEEFGQVNSWYNLAPVGSPMKPASPTDRAPMATLKKYPSSL